jgi:GT2 family glycosyltransferase
LSAEQSPKPGGQVGVGVFEVTTSPEEIDFSSATFWEETLLLDGVPVHRVDFASPGTATPRLVDALLTRRADYWIARSRLCDELCDRLGLRTPERPSPATTISVAVCTHGRPAYLPRLFEALGKLDPKPLEVLIIDNAPGEKDCRAQVEAAGFKYVREDRQGLDNARNTAIRHARGELIAFTDDDCVPSVGWLRAMPRLFEEPNIALVTGPMFPYELETRSQQRMEAVAGMVRGFDELRFDWKTLSVAHGSAIGVGANMTFRKSALEELGPEPFPPELDAGTPTESGGDTYVFGQILAANHEAIYSPEVFGFHDHRRDEAALIRAVRGYGTGISAAMTRLLVCDGEFETWRGWLWLVKQFLQASWRWLSGRSDRRQVTLSFEYVVGALIGPWRWFRSWRHESRFSPSALPPESAPVPDPSAAQTASSDEAGLQISVVIPTGGFGEALRKCLASLCDQTVAPGRFEVIVVDDRATPSNDGLDALPQPGRELRLFNTHGRGASSARNLGAQQARADLILFLDDDMVASRDLLECHLAHHDGQGPLAVVGSYLPYPVQPGLAAKTVALWWSNHFEALRRGGHRTFAWLLSGNLSTPRQAFLDVGGFPEHVPYRREDYELGLRWLGAGLPLVYAPDAAVRHEFSVGTRARLRGVVLEGFGDAMINRLYPGTSGVLPLVGHRSLGPKSDPRTLAHMLMRTSIVARASELTLDALEALKLRRRWMWVMSKQQSTRYKQGLERAQFSPHELKESLLDCELTDTQPVLKVGIVPPTIRVTYRGSELFRLKREEALWNESVARSITYSVPDDVLFGLGLQRGWLRAGDLTSEKKRSPAIAVHHLSAIKDRDALVELINTTREPFLMVVIGDVLDHVAWRDQTLLAFDGDRVGAVFGSGSSRDLPAQPVYLFRRTYPPDIRATARPAYVCFRTKALRAIPAQRIARGAEDPLAFTFTLIRWLLEDEWTVAWRDVPGLLASEHVGPAAIGRAATIAEMATVTDRHSLHAARTAAKIVARATTELRHRGNPRRRILGEAFGSLQAASARSSKAARREHHPDFTRVAGDPPARASGDASDGVAHHAQ